MKKLALFSAFIALFPGWAAAQWGDGYIGDTTVNTGNMNIAVQTDRHMIPLVKVQNQSGTPAQCSATFHHMPLFSETKMATIDPGENATLAYRKHHLTARVDIDVVCSPVGKG